MIGLQILLVVLVGTVGWFAFTWVLDKYVVPVLGYVILIALCLMFWPLVVIVLLLLVLKALNKIGAQVTA